MNDEEKAALNEEFKAKSVQRQTTQLEYDETKRTLEELEKTTNDVYVLVGDVFLKKKKEEIIEELKDKLDILEFRLKSLDKSLDELRQKLRE